MFKQFCYIFTLTLVLYSCQEINIDKEVAEELAMFRGECLGLYGVGIIDEEVMRILVQWRVHVVGPHVVRWLMCAPG